MGGGGGGMGSMGGMMGGGGGGGMGGMGGMMGGMMGGGGGGSMGGGKGGTAYVPPAVSMTPPTQRGDNPFENISGESTPPSSMQQSGEYKAQTNRGREMQDIIKILQEFAKSGQLKELSGSFREAIGGNQYAAAQAQPTGGFASSYGMGDAMSSAPVSSYTGWGGDLGY